MNTPTIACPHCGQPASGQFCSHCGAARGAGARWTAQRIAPWAALGVATLALGVALTAWFGQGGGGAPKEAAPLSAFTATLPPAGASAVDLSSMSPREAADRLFNRVMTAYENKRTEEVRQFAPMALQAYDRAGPLDNDARYHVALLHLTGDDVTSARAQIAALKQAVPNHLLAIMLEHQIAERGLNRTEMARANQAFLAAYDRENAAKRSEYEDHRGTIERFRQTAQAGAAKNR